LRWLQPWASHVGEKGTEEERWARPFTRVVREKVRAC
jgi:hypothetical protein